jgi:hypothetical protein
MEQQPQPVQTLEYAQQTATPWAAVVRVLGWFAIAWGAARLLPLAVDLLLMLGGMSWSLDDWYFGPTGEVLYSGLHLFDRVIGALLLVAGVGTLRFRRWAWPVYVIAIVTVVGTAVLLQIVSAIVLVFGPFPLGGPILALLYSLSWGLDRVILTAGAGALVLFLLTRPEVRGLFDTVAPPRERKVL